MKRSLRGHRGRFLGPGGRGRERGRRRDGGGGFGPTSTTASVGHPAPPRLAAPRHTTPARRGTGRRAAGTPGRAGCRRRRRRPGPCGIGRIDGMLGVPSSPSIARSCIAARTPAERPGRVADDRRGPPEVLLQEVVEQVRQAGGMLWLYSPETMMKRVGRPDLAGEPLEGLGGLARLDTPCTSGRAAGAGPRAGRSGSPGGPRPAPVERGTARP